MKNARKLREHSRVFAFLCKKEWFRLKLAKCCKVFLEDKKLIKNRILPITRGSITFEKELKNIFIYDAFEKFCPEKVCANKIDFKLRIS